MASLLLRRAWRSIYRPAWMPLIFPREGTVSIPASEKVEEEAIPGYLAKRYYPVRIGQIFQDRYQVVGKLGFGTTSTVWLARDLESVISSPLVSTCDLYVLANASTLHLSSTYNQNPSGVS